MGSYETTWGHMGPREDTWGHVKIRGATWGYVRLANKSKNIFQETEFLIVKKVKCGIYLWQLYSIVRVGMIKEYGLLDICALYRTLLQSLSQLWDHFSWKWPHILLSGIFYMFFQPIIREDCCCSHNHLKICPKIKEWWECHPYKNKIT